MSIIRCLPTKLRPSKCRSLSGDCEGGASFVDIGTAVVTDGGETVIGLFVVVDGGILLVVICAVVVSGFFVVVVGFVIGAIVVVVVIVVVAVVVLVDTEDDIGSAVVLLATLLEELGRVVSAVDVGLAMAFGVLESSETTGGLATFVGFVGTAVVASGA